MDYDCETNNMNQVYCCQCQRNFRLGFDELYSEQLIGDDYAEDGSLIPSYNYTCSTCYFKGQPASIGKINATAIDILRKVDNLQKDLDRIFINPISNTILTLFFLNSCVRRLPYFSRSIERSDINVFLISFFSARFNKNAVSLLDTTTLISAFSDLF